MGEQDTRGQAWLRQLVQRLSQSGPLAWLTLVLALVVLALTVGIGTLHLRVHLREHLADRDGEILSAVALARQYANGSGSNLTQRLGNPADQLALALDISQIREGALGVRLFDANGQFETAFPLTLNAAKLAPHDLRMLRALRPVSRFREQARVADYFLLTEEQGRGRRIPLLEVNIPLYARGDSNLVAVAQLLLDGRGIAQEYATVDRHLWPLAVGLYVGGAVVLGGVLMWAYGRLRKAHSLVEERTARLLRANHELALAAKTTALGSVTAHLIHGLSNPLANLQDFIAQHGDGASEEEMKDLAKSARRMQQIIDDVVRVLGEQRGGDEYQVAIAELADALDRKLRAASRESGVRLVTEMKAQGNLANRHANLVLLILENLAHNALKVTPPNGCVHIRLTAGNGAVHCEVRDQGPGISHDIARRLFAPCRSTQGGSGLGLAISKQLANQLGAELRLKSSSPAGCEFELTLPHRLFAEGDPVEIPHR